MCHRESESAPQLPSLPRPNPNSPRLGNKHALDPLDDHILLILGRVTLSQHLDIHARGHRSREDPSKRAELGGVGRRVELDNLDGERSLGIAGEHRFGERGVERSSVGRLDLSGGFGRSDQLELGEEAGERRNGPCSWLPRRDWVHDPPACRRNQ